MASCHIQLVASTPYLFVWLWLAVTHSWLPPLPICLPGYLAGWLWLAVIHSWFAYTPYLSGYLAGWLWLAVTRTQLVASTPCLAIWLSGWLVTWLAGYLAGWHTYTVSCLHSLSGYLAVWLAGYLAVCLVGYMAGWLWLAVTHSWLPPLPVPLSRYRLVPVCASARINNVSSHNAQPV